jgi:hypothetical protein
MSGKVFMKKFANFLSEVAECSHKVKTFKPFWQNFKHNTWLLKEPFKYTCGTPLFALFPFRKRARTRAYICLLLALPSKPAISVSTHIFLHFLYRLIVTQFSLFPTFIFTCRAPRFIMTSKRRKRRAERRRWKLFFSAHFDDCCSPRPSGCLNGTWPTTATNANATGETIGRPSAESIWPRNTRHEQLCHTQGSELLFRFSLRGESVSDVDSPEAEKSRRWQEKDKNITHEKFAPRKKERDGLKRASLLLVQQEIMTCETCLP